jgi:toxin CcdB
VVIPLSKAGNLRRNPLDALTPVLEIEGEDYVLLTPQLAGVARSDLGAPAGSVAQHRAQIVAALDFMVAGY